MEKQDPLRVPILKFMSNKTLSQILDGIEAMEEGEMKERLTNLYVDELEARQEGKPLVQDINEGVSQKDVIDIRENITKIVKEGKAEKNEEE